MTPPALKARVSWGSLDWGSWFYGLVWGSMGGGANAVSGALGAAVVDAKDFAIGSLQSFKLMGAIFAMTFLKDAALYLAQRPLPTAIETVTTVETISAQSSPPALVTTTVQTTETKPQEPSR